MKKERLVLFTSITAILAGVLVWLIVPGSQTQPEALSEAATPMDLGFTYLPVTPGLSEYYGLGVESGALVTEVIPGSLAERAGLQAGDVILSFNGTRLGETDSLLQMMMACPAEQVISLEVWRNKNVSTVQLVQVEGR